MAGSSWTAPTNTKGFNVSVHDATTLAAGRPTEPPPDPAVRVELRKLRHALRDVPREELPAVLADLARRVARREYDEALGDLVANVCIWTQFPDSALAELGSPTPLVARCVERVQAAGGRRSAALLDICREEARVEWGASHFTAVTVADSGAYPSCPGTADADAAAVQR